MITLNDATNVISGSRITAADDYAAVMAFLLGYDCMRPAGNFQQPFPTTDLPGLAQVTVGGTTCAPQATAPTARR